MIPSFIRLQVALAKFNCSPVGLLSQDLILGDGQPLSKGDTAELQYTGNLYTNQSFGKVLEACSKFYIFHNQEILLMIVSIFM